MYNLYSEDNLEFSGLSRHFLFRRLEPFSSYSLVLEACTPGGCTRTPPQRVTTAPAPPTSQPPPVPLSIGPDSVELAWSPPAQPNGPIGQYMLLGRGLEEGSGRSWDEEAMGGEVCCSDIINSSDYWTNTSMIIIVITAVIIIINLYFSKRPI